MHPAFLFPHCAPRAYLSCHHHGQQRGRGPESRGKVGARRRSGGGMDSGVAAANGFPILAAAGVATVIRA